jgi:hypothetical protein
MGFFLRFLRRLRAAFVSVSMFAAQHFANLLPRSRKI